MVGEYTPEMMALLEAQRAHFADDEHIRQEVALWADATPEQRLAEVAEMCAAGEHFLSRIDDAAFERMNALDALPADTIAILTELRRTSR